MIQENSANTKDSSTVKCSVKEVGARESSPNKPDTFVLYSKEFLILYSTVISILFTVLYSSLSTTVFSTGYNKVISEF